VLKIFSAPFCLTYMAMRGAAPVADLPLAMTSPGAVLIWREAARFAGGFAFKEALMQRLRQAPGAALFAAAFGLAALLAFGAQALASPEPVPPLPQAKPAAPAQPATHIPGDPFGKEVALQAKTIIAMKGTATWETAFQTLVGAFKSIDDYLDKQKLKPSGEPLVVYTDYDDIGFHYQVGIPVAEAPKNPPHGRLKIGQSPSGKSLEFVHRGSYDAMDTTYEAITDYLDNERLETEDMFIEEYVTDPVTTPQDKLIVNIYVPLKQK
jgi:effector-binding domain-containing protein